MSRSLPAPGGRLFSFGAGNKVQAMTKRITEETAREWLELTRRGESSYQIADKYGVDRGTVSKHLRLLGYAPGKGGGATARNNARRSKEAEATRIKRLNDLLADRFEVLESNPRLPCVMRCKECGHVFKRTIDMRHEPRCPECERRLAEMREHERELEHEQRLKRNVMQELVNLLSIEHVCPVCGRKFRSRYANAVYCSHECRKRADNRKKSKRSGRDHVRRAKRYGVAYEHGITLDRLVERDGLTCYLCGKTCDKSDTRWGSSGPDHPTIDHVIALKNGGTHTWDNVAVACGMCNSIKRDIPLNELQTPHP